MKELLSHGNVETRSHDYTTVDELVFSPCRDEPSSTVPWRVAHRFASSSLASPRIASPRLVCCQATAINTWVTQEWKGVTWPRQQWRHATRFNSDATIEAPLDGAFPACHKSRVYRSSQEDLSVSSREQTAVEGSELEKSWSCELKT
jgi:hypothetical protein